MSNKGLYGSPNPVGKEDTKQVAYGNLNKNFNLSPADMGKTVRIDQPNGYGVILPDARMLRSSKLVTIRNTHSAGGLFVYDNAGGYLQIIYAGNTAIFWNTGAMTAGGVWAIAGVGFIGDTAVSPVTMLSGITNVDCVEVCALSDTTALVTYRQVSGYAYAHALQLSNLTASGSTLLVGPQVVIYAAYSNFVTNMKLTATTAAVGWHDSTPWGNLRVVTVSGTTLSLGPIFTAGPGNIGAPCFAAVSPTLVVSVATNQLTNYGLKAVAYTIDGTSISQRNSYNFASSEEMPVSQGLTARAIAGISPTQLAIVYDHGHPVYQHSVLIYDPTSYIVSSPKVVPRGAAGPKALAVLSPTQIVVVDIAAREVCLYTVSYLNLVRASILVDPFVAGYPGTPELVALSPTLLLMTYTESGRLLSVFLEVVDNIVRTKGPTKIEAGPFSSVKIARMGATQGILATITTSAAVAPLTIRP